MIWRQRSRALCLSEGDRNKKFFHGKVEQQKRTNHIAKLKDDRGVWWKGEDHYERILVKYFSKMFSSSSPANIEDVCLVVKGKITRDNQLWCEAMYSPNEVKEALNRMHPSKASGSYGLPALFF